MTVWSDLQIPASPNAYNEINLSYINQFTISDNILRIITNLSSVLTHFGIIAFTHKDGLKKFIS